MIDPLAPEADPHAALVAAGLRPSDWSAPPFTHFDTHQHESTKRLFVIEGAIAFNGQWLRAADGIRIAAGTAHDAEVGEHGVRCVEAFE